jgi:PAS domain S-box-containing protein
MDTGRDQPGIVRLKSKKTSQTVIGRSSATRGSGQHSDDKRPVDDCGEDSRKLRGTRQGRGTPLGQSGLTPESIRRVKKKITGQQRAQRRRIGELRTTSEALSHEIDQYKQVLDGSRLHLEILHKLPAVAWTVTPEGNCDFVNQFYLDATALTADYCTAPLEKWSKTSSDLPPFLSVLHPDHQERVSHIFWDGVRSGGGWTFEAPFLHADGSYHWHFDRAVPVRDAQGKVLRFVGSSADIHELRSVRDSLVDRERRLLAIIDDSPNPIFLKDSDGRYLLVNREFERLAGISRDQIVGKTDEDLPRLRDAAAFQTYDRDAHRPGEEVGSEELAATDRGPRWSVVQKFPIVDRGSRLYATAHMTTDVIARKKAEDLVRLAEDRARSILDSSLDAVVTIDASHVITGWSKSAEAMFGWPCQEAVGRSITDTIIPTHYRDAHLRGFEHFLATGEGPILNKRIETAALHKAGHEFPIELTVTAIRLETTWHFTAFVRDLTDKRRVEEALREARDEVTRVTRLTAMGQLSASIAHEINQPLTAMAANSDTCLYWLTREEPNLAKARAAAQRLAKDARRASEIIARIKALTNKTTVERALLDINKVVRDVLKLMQGELRKHRITTLVDLNESVPLINGDRVQLQQVILNVVLNGIESMTLVGDRQRTLSIRSGVLDNRTVEMSFHDTGVGLDSTMVDRLFDAFFTTKRNGTGMGLAICRSIIEAHDGHISAAAGAPFGAVFQFTLPIADGS